MERHARPSPARLFERPYARGGVSSVRRALFAQLGLAFVVASIGAFLTLLYAPELSVADLAIVLALSWLIYVADGALAIRPIRDGLVPLEEWSRRRDEPSARAAWRAAADLPFALLRRRASYVAVAVLIIVWDVVGVRRLGLSTASFLLFVPGSILVWLYWLALRFFVMEQILRPVLADVGRELPDGGGVPRSRVTLARRLLVAVPAITIVAGTIVAGVVGNHTVGTVALGVGVSLLVVATIASWLVVLLADSVAGPIGDLQEAAERVGRGDLAVRVPVVSVDETGALAQSFNAMVEGLRERERIREAFGTYVDRDVAEHILREGTSLAGEEVEVTMMFIDIRDFTGFSERATATEVVATINRMFDRAVPVIHAHHGHVDKFVGDGLLAVFGAPRRQEDHADQALAAALEISDAVSEEFGGELEIGVGLNSGTVVAGNVGGGGRLEFSVIGDAVNVAARVEAATRRTGDVVLLAENVKRLLRSDEVPLVERSGVPLKGKSEEVMLYAPRLAADGY
jgi:class 3 adenylate cyclase